eukprot:CAMPEP_0114440946 /NCGR_PEP_ID=MMETSP0103-20121206/16083_1 /TAXON_ID=37642 ORGANISM="Paraphysomonas imperforata, Strain PA2" /NCGR_SAMPLE_ID=MMETSP0103 /ASSEMBLY_ACC=CAM_ASM_000201 /LENGTH=478 /DNA_ID=CAMNT_0001611969 /DNA_START=89 /DNA_END=1525 /DNA_ORIENTATION=+
MLSTLFLAVCIFAPCAAADEAESDKIENLPGVDFPLTFDQYAGYFHFQSRRGFRGEILQRSVFYWFVESSEDPASDPVVFWTNGGPGCSGLLGFMSELGPFRPSRDGGLDLNPYSWNQRANVVFIESPVGVGFSHSSDIHVDYADDRSTASLNHKVITSFFKRYPKFQTNDLYLASESYGGHYLPTLALELVQDASLNFKGFSVGNPFTTVTSGDYSFLNTAWGHQMIAQPTWTRFQRECKEATHPDLEQCASLEIDMHIQMGKLNPYAIDFPSCVPNSAVQSDRLLKTVASSSYELGKSKYPVQKGPPILSAKGIKNKLEYEPCEDDYVSRYLNRVDVQTAIHAASDEDDWRTWNKCSVDLKYSHFDSQVSMVPIYKQLLSDPNLDLQILVYSGDDDSICGTVGTQDWIWDLGFELSTNSVWQPYMVNAAHAGYYTKWKNVKLAFVTVRDAGHEVPRYKPAVALDMWHKFLDREWFS